MLQTDRATSRYPAPRHSNFGINYFIAQGGFLAECFSVFVIYYQHRRICTTESILFRQQPSPIIIIYGGSWDLCLFPLMWLLFVSAESPHSIINTDVGSMSPSSKPRQSPSHRRYISRPRSIFPKTKEVVILGFIDWISVNGIMIMMT